jgi:hypothetical protein
VSQPAPEEAHVIQEENDEEIGEQVLIPKELTPPPPPSRASSSSHRGKSVTSDRGSKRRKTESGEEALKDLLNED